MEPRPKTSKKSPSKPKAGRVPKNAFKNPAKKINKVSDQDTKLLFKCVQLQGQVTPGDLAKELHWNKGTLSQHLKKLVARGEIERLGSGQNTSYKAVTKSEENSPVEELEPSQTIIPPVENKQSEISNPVTTVQKESNSVSLFTLEDLQDPAKNLEKAKSKANIWRAVILLEILVILIWYLSQIFSHHS